MPRQARRRFLQTAAVGTAGTLLAGPNALAQEKPDVHAQAARHLAQVARLRLGTQLTDDQLKAVAQRLARASATGELLQRTRLENGDEPAFVFLPEEAI